LKYKTAKCKIKNQSC